MRMSPAEIAELRKMLDGILAMSTAGTEEPEPTPPEPVKPASRAEPPAAEFELGDYNELEAEEIIALLRSLERNELEALRVLESDSRARPSVLHAIDSVLARAPTPG